MVEQNRFTSHFSFDRVTEENATLRLNKKTASIGFIYRHIGETMNLFGQFLGIPTDVTNSTIGETDDGQVFDVKYSRELIAKGYEMLKALVENSSDEDWLKPVETPFLERFPDKAVRAHPLPQLTSRRPDISHSGKRNIRSERPQYLASQSPHPTPPATPSPQTTTYRRHNSSPPAPAGVCISLKKIGR